MAQWTATQIPRAWQVRMRLGIRCLAPVDAELLSLWVATYGAHVKQWLPRPPGSRIPLTVSADFGSDIGGKLLWTHAWPMVSLHGEGHSQRAWLVRGTATELHDDFPGGKDGEDYNPTVTLRPGTQNVAALDDPSYLTQVCGRAGEWIVWLASETFWPDWLEGELKKATATPGGRPGRRR